MDSTAARSHRSPRVVRLKLDRIDDEHVHPLNDWVDSESTESRTMPWFDPGDAGIDARVLFLLESPGPKSVKGTGSGIISVDNDDTTAANLWKFRADAGLTSECIHWNAVPWYLGTDSRKVVAPARADYEPGANALASLLTLLPAVEVIVPMGKHARPVADLYLSRSRRTDLFVLPTWHPSSLGLNGAPGRKEEIASVLRAVATLLTLNEERSLGRPAVRDRLSHARDKIVRRAKGGPNRPI